MSVSPSFIKIKIFSGSLFDINKELYEGISEKQHPILIFLKLKKAFDSVGRSKLLSKLNKIGVRGKFNWVKVKRNYNIFP